jgi:hypothetical protein
MRTLLFLLLACTAPKPEDSADRGAEDPASTDSGTEDSGMNTSDTQDTGDTGDTSDTGDSGDPAVSDCTLLARTSWRSVEELECGLTPEGVALCNWSVNFTESDWTWHHSDVAEAGSWSCESGEITGERGMGSPVSGTLHDAEHLTWDGVAYVPEGSGGADTGSDTGGGTGSDTGADTGGDTGGDTSLCDSLPGSGWASEDLLECGRGGAMCHWSIAFTESAWSFLHSDVGETGLWSCEAGVLTGAASWGSPVRAYLSDSSHLSWDGIVYLRTR